MPTGAPCQHLQQRGHPCPEPQDLPGRGGSLDAAAPGPCWGSRVSCPLSQAPKSFLPTVGALLCDPSTSLWGFRVGWPGANRDGVGGKCGHGHWVMGVLSPRRGPEGQLGLKAGSIGASRQSWPRGEPGPSVSPVGGQDQEEHLSQFSSFVSRLLMSRVWAAQEKGQHEQRRGQQRESGQRVKGGEGSGAWQR